MYKDLREKTIVDIRDNHLFPATLLCEFRNGKLDSELNDKIRLALFQNRPDHIEESDLSQFCQREFIPAATRMTIDEYALKTLASFSQNKTDTALARIHDINQFVFIHRFEAIAQYYPNEIALRFNEETLTYQQVNERANQIAHLLIQQGIEKEQLVGTFLPRSPEWIIAILAIWKAGAAFVPIDPTIPAGSFKVRAQYLEKFNHLLNDSGVSCIITDSILQCRIPNHKTIAIDSDKALIDDQPHNNPGITVSPSDLSYVMYTSGSTGKPKGVQIEHRGLMPCLEAHRQCVDLTQETIMAQYASAGFDAWLAEMLILGLGGTLAIIPTELRLDPQGLKAYCNRYKTTAAIFTPHLLKQLGGYKDFPLWRALFIVGEKFGIDLVKQWQTEKLQVVNGYGLTETTICTTLENLNVPYDDPQDQLLSIGKPILGTEIKLIQPEDEQSKAGEIFISGVSLTRDYYGEARKPNLDRFVKFDGKRWYKTGDKAIKLSDNRYKVIGRYNRVVKFNSKRVDLDGLENILANHPAIEPEGAACIADEALGREAKLVVFLQPKDQDKHPDDHSMQTYLNNEDIRTAGVPITITWKHEPFQKTVNGKKDYKALEEEYKKRQSNNEKVIEQSTHQDLLNIWQAILQTEQPITDTTNFFEAGGSSVSVMLLLRALRKKYPKLKDELNALLLFEYDTLESQAQLLSNLQTPLSVVQLTQPKKSKYRLFCLPSILGRPEWDYQGMADQFCKEFPSLQIVAFEARGIKNPEAMPQSIESMAADYIFSLLDYRKRKKDTGPIHIMGWSSGGTIAIEAVRQLRARGFQAYPYVIDTVAPFYYQQLNPTQLTDELISLTQMIAEKCNIKIDFDQEKVNRQQTMLDKINFVFDLLRSNQNDINAIIQVAKTIRIAEQFYLPMEALPPFELFVADKKILNGTNETLNWPQTMAHKEEVQNTDHFSILESSQMHQTLIKSIKSSYRTYKLLKIKKEFIGKKDYVIPSVRTSEQDHSLTPINSAIESFLKNPTTRILLLQGEAGMGKSTSVEQIYSAINSRKVPVKQLNLSLYKCKKVKKAIKKQIKKWKKKSTETRVLILDGYDERQGQLSFDNYYGTANLAKYQNLKVIFTCRSEELGPNYRTNFMSENSDEFEEWKLEGLSPDLIKEFIINSVGKEKSDQYYDEIIRHHDLKKLAKNPQILGFILESFNKLRTYENKATRYTIFEALTNTRFESAELKLKNKPGFSINNYQEQCRALCQELALELFLKNTTTIKHKPKKASDIKTIKRKSNRENDLFDLLLGESNKVFIRGCPLDIHNNRYQFLHKSFLEYFVANYIASVFSDPDYDENSIQDWLNKKSITPQQLIKDKSVIRFFKEACENNPKIIDRLIYFRNLTKKNPDFSKLGDITMTLLNMIGYPFSGEDLSHLNAPNAILAGGIFHHTNLDHSNLKNANLCDAHLVNASLKGADLSNAFFGELPRLQAIGNITCWTESPDGRWLFFGYNDGVIQCFEKSTNYSHIVTRHYQGESILSLVCMKDSFNLAITSSRGTIDLWETSITDLVIDQENGKDLCQKYSNMIPDLQVIKIKLCKQIKSDDYKYYGAKYSSNLNHIITLSEEKNTDSHDQQVVNLELTDTNNSLESMYAKFLSKKKKQNRLIQITIWNGDLTKEEKTIDLNARPSSLMEIGSQITYLEKEKYLIYLIEGGIAILDTTKNKSLTLKIRSVTCFGVSQNNNFIAVGNKNGIIKVWDLLSLFKEKNLDPLHQLSIHTSWINALAFTKDDKYLISGSGDKSILVWDTEDFQCVFKFEANKSHVDHLLVSNDQKHIISRTSNNCIRFFSLQSISEQKNKNGHQGKVTRVSFSSDGRSVLSSSWDTTARIWETENGDLVEQYQSNTRLNKACFSDNDEYIYYSINNHHMTKISTSKSSPQIYFDYHSENWLYDIFSIPGSTKLLTAHYYGMLHVWNKNNGSLMQTVQLNDVNLQSNKRTLFRIAYSAGLGFLAIASWNSSVIILNADNYQIHTRLKNHNAAVYSVTYSPNSQYLLSGSKDSTIHIYDTKDYELKKTLKDHSGAIIEICYSENGATLASASYDRTIRVWNPETFECMQVITGFKNSLSSIALNKTGDRLATGGDDHSVRVYRHFKQKNKFLLMWSSNPYLTITKEPNSTIIDDKTNVSQANKTLLEMPDELIDTDNKNLAKQILELVK